MIIILLTPQLLNANDSTNNLIVIPYGTEEGLRQSMVKQVFLDSKGLIWLVTGDGLHFFDGTNFNVYRIPRELATSQLDNVMRNVIESVDGKFILSSSSSLSQFDPTTGRFSIICQKEGLYPQVFCDLLERKPLVWMNDSGYSIVKGNELIPIKFQFLDNQLPSPTFVPLKLLDLGQHHYLIQGLEGIIDFHFQPKDSIYQATWNSFDKQCLAIDCDHDHNVYLLMGTKVYTYDGNGKITEYMDTKVANNNAIFIDSKKSIWISNAGRKEIFRIMEKKFEKIRLITRNGRRTDVIYPFTINFFEDNQKNIWICTDGNGVFKYQPNQIQFSKADIGFVRCINSMNNEIWVGTFNNGLWRLNPDLSNPTRVLENYYTNESDILDIAADGYLRKWVVSRDRLDIINPTGKIVFSLPLSISVAKLIQHSMDTMLLSTDNNLFTFKVGEVPRLISNEKHYHFSTWEILGDYEWFGSSSGLYIINRSSGHGYDKFRDHKKSTLQVKSILPFSHEVWVSSSAGVDIYDFAGNPLEAPESFQELKNEIIYSLLRDKLNRVWFSSNLGVGCISNDRSKIIYFNYSNNLQSLEFNSNAYYESKDGTIYFGGIYGLNGINPNELIFTNTKSTPIIISLALSDTLYSSGVGVDPRKVKLRWNSAHVWGKVFSTNYFNSGDQHYSFYLKDYDSKWSTPAKQNIFSYRNLRPGSYSLLVKYSDSYRNWSNPIQILEIVVTPPLWEQRWFISLGIIIIVFITVVTVRSIQSAKYQKRIKELEFQNAIETERLRISRDLHDDLGAGLSLIILNASVAQQHIKDEVQVKSFIDSIARNAKDLYENMNNLIWLLKQENQSMGALYAKLREVVSDMIEDAGCSCIIDLPEQHESLILHRDVSRQLFLLVKEVVNNAIKYSAATEISIQLSIDKGVFCLSIKDDGVGFIPDQVFGKGNGLMNIKTRAKQISGVVEIQSAPNNGTHVRFTVDLSQIVIS